jgi:hypothetical protein
MAFNPLESILAGLQGRKEFDQNQAQQNLAQASAQPGFNSSFSPEMQRVAALSKDPGAEFLKLSKERKQSFFNDAQKGLNLAGANKWDEVRNLAEKRIERIQRVGGDVGGTGDIITAIDNQDFAGATQLLQMGVSAGVSEGFLKDPREADLKRREREARIESLGRGTGRAGDFNRRTAGLTKEQKREAQLIDLGLSPRAVGSAIQTITDKGIADAIGNTEAIIAGRKKFGELSGSSRAKRIDSGFDKVTKINAGILNIDRAVALLNKGAGVGALEKFLPSFKAASVELGNVQKSMALDVIGAVTFGALSEGELQLAKDVALPTGLDTPDLINHLNERKAAQGKLRDYYNEQIQFLDQGGTVAGFLRKKERETEQNRIPDTTSFDGGQGEQRNITVDF